MMRNDPIVEEMRANGRAFAAEHGNDIGRICKALRQKQQESVRQVVTRKPKRLEQRTAS
jgi:hypothetical protein